MSARRTLDRMRSNPDGWRIEDLQTVATAHGIEWRRPSGGGSHVIFSVPGRREIVSVPSRRPIKSVYVRQFLSLIGVGTGEA